VLAIRVLAVWEEGEEGQQAVVLLGVEEEVQPAVLIKQVPLVMVEELAGLLVVGKAR
jgi:hypothetical protein